MTKRKPRKQTWVYYVDPETAPSRRHNIRILKQDAIDSQKASAWHVSGITYESDEQAFDDFCANNWVQRIEEE
jgi:hypothetical protein